MRFSWKLLPVAALFALGVFMISLPGSPTTVNATPTGATTVNPIAVPTLGSTAIVTATYNDDQPLPNPSPAVLTTTNPTVGYFLTGGSTVSPPNGEVLTVTTSAVTVPEDADSVAAPKTLTATFVCQTAGTTTFILTHGGTASLTNATLTCGSGVGATTATVTASPQLVPVGAQGSIVVSFSSVAGQNITLNASPFGYALFNQQPTVTPAGSGEIFTGTGTSTLSFVSIQTTQRTLYVSFTCSQVGTVTFTLNVNGVIAGSSTPIYCGQGTALTPTVGLASSVTVAASPTSVSCNGTAFVTVTVRNIAGGYVADGTSVTLTTSIGTLSPTTATTLGGGVLAVFTAPGNQSGTATINAAAAGTTTGSATITVACQSATPTPAVPPTIYVPPPVQQIPSGQIAPPNTGDAGLADDNSWRTYGGLAMVVVSVMAAAAVVRKRA